MWVSILNSYQIAFLKLLSIAEWSKDFYLAWWTALAIHFHHRLSDDLDFFSQKLFASQMIDAFLQDNKTNLNIKNFSKQKLYDRNIYFLDYTDWFQLKIEFTPYFKPCYPLIKDKTLWVFLEDISDTFLDKIAAMLDRIEVKDYVDFYYLYQSLKPKNQTDKKFLATILISFEKKFWYTIFLISCIHIFLKASNLVYDAIIPNMKKNLKIWDLKSFYLKIAVSLKEDPFE